MLLLECNILIRFGWVPRVEHPRRLQGLSLDHVAASFNFALKLSVHCLGLMRDRIYSAAIRLAVNLSMRSF